jgi:hypothetical protein
MVEKKELLLCGYFDVTKAAIESLESDHMEDLLRLLDVREDLIKQMNLLDQDHGSVITNPTIKQLLGDIQHLDQLLVKRMQEKKKEIQSKLNSIQQGKQLKYQYSSRYHNMDGIFYDKRK